MLTVKDPKRTVWKEMPLDTLSYGNCLDTYFTLKVFEELEKDMYESDVEQLITELINPCIPIFAEMEFGGLGVDTDVLGPLDKLLGKQVIKLEDSIYNDFEEVKSEYNINSSADIIKIMYTDEEGFCLFPTLVTKTGKPSTDAKVLTVLGEMIDEELERRGKY